MKRKVAVVLGSDSDLPQAREGLELLDEMGVGYDLRILSAHRTPEDVREFARRAHENYDVVIAGAGGAAHLAGAISSQTRLPVVGIPIETRGLGGLDSLLSTVQMPRGVPVAAVSIGEAGAVNACVLACRIIALGDEEIRGRLEEYVRKGAERVREKDRSVR